MYIIWILLASKFANPQLAKSGQEPAKNEAPRWPTLQQMPLDVS